jgi:hypothetical protein
VCQAELAQLMNAHFSGATGNFAAHPVGLTIPALPSTAVLLGKAHQAAEKAQADYRKAMNPEFGKNFAIPDREEIRFGYWGRENWLAQIAVNRDISDEKSRRFLSLGQTTWKAALGLSPAEPGLSPFKPFEARGMHLTSAGGWSDLHPVLALKAAGCDNVVYLTRRGGESLFGQGVAKRLLGFDRDWSVLSSSSDEAKKANAKLNNNGDPSDMTSLWSRLYNLANPRSSFRRALSLADAVLCTDWDAHEITEGVHDMIEDAYNAPYSVSVETRLMTSQLTPMLDAQVMSADGYPVYAGCF